MEQSRMLRSLLIAAFAAASLLCSQDSEAAPKRCDSCHSDVDFRLIAEAMGPGSHHIYNLNSNILQHWRVPPGVVPLSGAARINSSSTSATKLANSPEAVDELSRAHTLHVIGAGSIRPIFNVPVDLLNLTATQGRTAHDVVVDNNLRGQIESKTASTELMSQVAGAEFINALSDLVNVGTSILGLRGQAGMIMRVVMSDGSYIDVQIAIDQSIGEVQIETARTAGGQVIPGHVQETTGTWTYSPVDDLGRMVDHFRTLGATVRIVGPPSGIVRSLSCTPTGCVAEYFFR